VTADVRPVDLAVLDVEASSTVQRSFVAGRRRLLAPHGQATSQLQLSKYVPRSW